ncbi:MAG: hypothetical protein WD533_09235 [Dehalococcoidia bacterium]
MRKYLRNTPITILAILAVLGVLVGGGRGDGPSELQRATGPYQQDIVRWEISHFMDKWVHLALRPIQGTPTEEEERQAIAEFFSLGEEERLLLAEMEQLLASSPDAAGTARDIGGALETVQDQRKDLHPVVQEAMESAITQALEEMDVIDRIGPIRWPPVNFTFAPNGLVLVRSPRDEILRLEDMLLRSDVPLLEQIALEEQLEEDGDTSALVIRVGGIATYPAQVMPHASLHHTLFLAAHEWLHHWMFFRPLGKQWWAGGEMTSINETVADILGEEVGDRAYELLTGRTVQREPWQPPSARPPYEPEPGVFDFTYEMRQTRMHLEALLEADRVEKAEEYLEERRRVFVAHGWNLRKLNTAWFAFYGTYAIGPGSISPIEDQLRTLRAESGSLATFLDHISSINGPGQLESIARSAGWAPLDADA